MAERTSWSGARDRHARGWRGSWTRACIGMGKQYDDVIVVRGQIERDEGVASGYDWWIWDLGSSRDRSGRRRRRRRGGRGARRCASSASRGVARCRVVEGRRVRRMQSEPMTTTTTCSWFTLVFLVKF